MRALIIEEDVHSSLMAAFITCDPPHKLYRILVPEANNLTITKTDDTVFCATGFDRVPVVVRETTIPDELVEVALSNAKTQAELMFYRDMMTGLIYGN